MNRRQGQDKKRISPYQKIHHLLPGLDPYKDLKSQQSQEYISNRRKSLQKKDLYQNKNFDLSLTDQVLIQAREIIKHNQKKQQAIRYELQPRRLSPHFSQKIQTQKCLSQYPNKILQYLQINEYLSSLEQNIFVQDEKQAKKQINKFWKQFSNNYQLSQYQGFEIFLLSLRKALIHIDKLLKQNSSKKLKNYTAELQNKNIEIQNYLKKICHSYKDMKQQVIDTETQLQKIQIQNKEMHAQISKTHLNLMQKSQIIVELRQKLKKNMKRSQCQQFRSNELDQKKLALEQQIMYLKQANKTILRENQYLIRQFQNAKNLKSTSANLSTFKDFDADWQEQKSKTRINERKKLGITCKSLTLLDEYEQVFEEAESQRLGMGNFQQDNRNNQEKQKLKSLALEWKQKLTLIVNESSAQIYSLKQELKQKNDTILSLETEIQRLQKLRKNSSSIQQKQPSFCKDGGM